MSNPVQQAAEDKVLYSTDTVHRLVLYSRGCMSREGIWVPAPPTTSSLENATPPRPLPLSTPPPPANETQEDTSDETPETSNPQKEVEPEGNNPPSPPRPNSKPGEESENEEKGSDGEGWVTKKLRSGKKRIEHRTINKDKILKDLSVKKSNVVKKLI